MGEPTRLEPTDARDYPTIRVGGGESVPVPYASAGILRVLSMAYMIIWSWHEHTAACSLKEQPHASRVVVLWDEVESHLHPNWQRRILPSFLSALNGLMGPKVETQLLLATHSPLVTASLESILDPDQDKIFRFDLVSGELVVEEQTLEKRGAADIWLEDLFETPTPGSLERQAALTGANLAMREKCSDAGRLDTIQLQMAAALPDADPFWVDWTLFRREVQGK